MADAIPKYDLPKAPALLERLKAMADPPTEFNSLMVVSLSMLPVASSTDDFWVDFNRGMVEFAERYLGKVFELGATERGILIKMTDFNQVGINSDIKVILLRLIQEHFPDNFGMVDQSRLVRVIDLRFKMAAAQKMMERLVATDEDEKQPEFHKMRRLQEDDIGMVVQVSKELGTEQFSKVFIRDQKIAIIHPDQAPLPVMHEYFIGMDMLKKHVFKQVELRGSGNLFNQLTITLDQLVLGCFVDLNPAQAKCSINLNVESVFTRSFQSFVESGDDKVFANVVFEFRQANILQHYDEFMIASDLIRSKAGTVAVDAIFPDTIGVVNLDRLNANMAKIFWRSGAEDILPKYKDEIAAIQKAGTVLVLARLDDEVGLNTGHELGITMFQGFYLDDMLSAKEATG